MEVSRQQFENDLLTAQVIFGKSNIYNKAVFGEKDLIINDPISKAIDYIENKYPLSTELLLVGNTGTGKTFAGCCVLNRLSEVIKHINDISTGIFLNASEASNILKFKHLSSFEDKYLNIKHKKIVMIDDISVIDSKQIDEFYLNLIELLSIRQANRKYTIITSNIAIDQYESLPAALKSRLSKAYKVEVTGNDLRKEENISINLSNVIQIKQYTAETSSYKKLDEDTKYKCLVTMYFEGLNSFEPDTCIAYEMAERWNVNINEIIPGAQLIESRFNKVKKKYTRASNTSLVGCIS